MDLSNLIAKATRYHVDAEGKSGALPCLSVYTREEVSDIEASVYEPVMCLILQGSKITSIGDQRVDLRPGDALVVSHDLPVASRITRASRAEPYIAVLLALDLALVRGLHDQMAADSLPEAEARPLSAWQAEPGWLDPLTRYFELMDHPMDAQVLGPAILREVHYRLMRVPIGAMLRRLLRTDSHASRVALAIHMLRREFRTQLRVTDLAQRAGMSPSSFHAHFKAVTGTTPLQYQKDLRLIEARALLRTQGATVSDAAYGVGYESPTQFSRDYSKKFGVPPSRETPSPSA